MSPFVRHRVTPEQQVLLEEVRRRAGEREQALAHLKEVRERLYLAIYEARLQGVPMTHLQEATGILRHNLYDAMERTEIKLMEEV